MRVAIIAAALFAAVAAQPAMAQGAAKSAATTTSTATANLMKSAPGFPRKRTRPCYAGTPYCA